MNWHHPLVVGCGISLLVAFVFAIPVWQTHQAYRLVVRAIQQRLTEIEKLLDIADLIVVRKEPRQTEDLLDQLTLSVSIASLVGSHLWARRVKMPLKLQPRTDIIIERIGRHLKALRGDGADPQVVTKLGDEMKWLWLCDARPGTAGPWSEPPWSELPW